LVSTSMTFASLSSRRLPEGWWSPFERHTRLARSTWLTLLV
jgi:hypothetical protein